MVAAAQWLCACAGGVVPDPYAYGSRGPVRADALVRTLYVRNEAYFYGRATGTGTHV